MHFITSFISGAFGLVFFIAWVLLVVYALLDIMRNTNFNNSTKLLWIIVILIAPILGSLIYIFWGRTQNFL